MDSSRNYILVNYVIVICIILLYTKIEHCIKKFKVTVSSLIALLIFTITGIINTAYK